MLRVAYLNTRYPALSHTFIEREVRAVRASGVEVHTFSIRRPGHSDKLSGAHREAFEQTYYLYTNLLRLLVGQVLGAMCRPWGYVRAAAASQRLANPGWWSHLLHLVYLFEAVVLARQMKRRGLRHVHVHMANNGAAVALLACRYDRRLSYSLSIHGSAEFFNVKTVNLKAKTEGAMFVRCISDFCRAQVMAWCSPRFWSRTHVVHCGVDVEQYQPRAPLGPGPLRLLTVGRLDPIKGYPLLLEACRKLEDRGIPWRLIMVGDGPLREELKRLAQHLRIADRVEFTGAVGQDRIQEHFERADVMVVSSFMEGVPVVLMEAMAKQLAVLSTAVAGVPELVGDGVSGVLVRPGSAESLAGGLRRLASDRAFLGRLGQAGRKQILREFNIEAVGEQMAALFARYGVDGGARTTEEPLPVAMPLAARAGVS